jgi:release factor glutamine methyltransferase
MLSCKQLYINIIHGLSAHFEKNEATWLADRLLEFYAEITPVQRIIKADNPIQSKTIELIDAAIERLCRNEPLQYITGVAWFMDMELEVNSNVLIPRPETEEMVQLIIEKYRQLASGKIQVLDIGAGSGCIPVAIKKEFPGWEVSSVDISAEALAIAARNASKYNAIINFLHLDILNNDCWPAIPEMDIIVSNPPYVTQADKALMKPNVLEYEPFAALFAPDDDPLAFYRAILKLAETKLKPHGEIWFEINEQFGPQLQQLAHKFGFTDANIIFDISGKSRFLHCIKTDSSIISLNTKKL